jgi:hypothetical protein
MSSNENMAAIIVGGIVLGLLLVVVLPVVLGLRHSAKRQELKHAERMKSLELGRPWTGEMPASAVASEDSNGPENPGGKIGVTVPLGALGIAFVATVSQPPSTAATIAIWSAAGVVGVAGVICGTILTLRMRPSDAHKPAQLTAAKPPAEEEALDLIGRRG